MLGRTHLAAGAAAGAAVGLATGHPLLGMAMGAIGGLIPDIDHTGSILGQKLLILSIPLSYIFSHRSLTHTVWFALAVSLLPQLLFPILISLSISLTYDTILLSSAYLFIGCISHLILDGITVSGVEPLPPLAWHPRGPFRTGDDLVELPLAAGFLILAIRFCVVM